MNRALPVHWLPLRLLAGAALALTLASCTAQDADSGPYTPPCHDNWSLAPCGQEWDALYVCDDCDQAYQCSTMTDGTTTWQMVDLSCTCVQSDGTRSHEPDCAPESE